MTWAVLYLFDHSDNLKLCRGVEAVSFLPQQQPEVAGHIPASYVRSHDAVWHGKTLVDGYSMGYPVTRVQHYTCRPTSSISTHKTVTSLSYMDMNKHKLTSTAT